MAMTRKTRRKTSIPVAAVLAASVIAIGAPAHAQSGAAGGDAEARTFAVEAPEVIDVGWGWSQSRVEPIPTICVTFTEESNTAQTASITISEVRDSFALSKKMNISASASVKGVGYKASGKASFAKDSSISSSSVSFLVDASVVNGAVYAGPAEDPRGRGGPAVRLTPAMAALAQRDIEQFQEVCGEGYVSAKITGAQAYLLATTSTTSEMQRESMRASVSGEGWGVKVEAAVSGSSEAGTESFSRDVSFFQQGGAYGLGEDSSDLPRDAASAIARIEKLASAASTAPKTFSVEITPYQVLENFPRGADILAEEDEQDEIAALAASYTKIYADLREAMERPADFLAPLVRCVGGTCKLDFVKADDPDAILQMEALQDVALDALEMIEIGARDCISAEEDCAFDAAAIRSPYAVRVSMPIPAPMVTTTKTETVDGEEVETVTTTPGPSPTVTDHAALFLREPAEGRCGFGATTPGCIRNSEIRDWMKRTGLAFSVSSDPAALAGKIAACDGITGDHVLTGDANRSGAADQAGADIVWHPVGLTFDENGAPICNAAVLTPGAAPSQ